MFVDHAKVYVKAGDGGDGMVAFRREKYIPNGGPAGGDGGQGAHVIFKVDEGLRTLMDFKYQRHFKADKGENGMSKGKHGRSAEDMVVMVPPGTVVKNAMTGELIADLTEDGQQAVIARGGRGGRGNIRFASAKNPAPNIAENGEPGEEVEVELELKILADVGLIGFPSVGKSTLLSVISAAKPKIASYPFTTIAPNLGVVDLKDGRFFTVGDMPGLIEGAASGTGLGLNFLRHIERARVLLFVLDMGAFEGRDPFRDYQILRQELGEYDQHLLERPYLIIANKMDIPGAEENLDRFKRDLKEKSENIPSIYPVSAATRQGIQELLEDIYQLVLESPDLKEETNQEGHVLYQLDEEEEPFTIERDGDGTWLVIGEKVEKMYHMTNLNYDESIMRFSRQLRHLGVDDALRRRGAQDGDQVQIADFVFEFVDG